MSWVEIHSMFIEFANVPLLVEHEFLTTPVIISVISEQFPHRSYKVGFLKTLAQIEGIGAVVIYSRSIYTGSRLLEIPLVVTNSFRLEFTPLPYVRNLNLRFWVKTE